MVNLTQTVSTSNNWEDLLELLRNELQEYGGLIGLLNAQQQTILNRKPIVFWRLTSPYKLRWKRAKSYKSVAKVMYRIWL